MFKEKNMVLQFAAVSPFLFLVTVARDSGVLREGGGVKGVPVPCHIACTQILSILFFNLKKVQMGCRVGCRE